MITLKKSLGQHFLKDESVITDIISALTQEPFTQLLEVGPGAGALTRHLLKLPHVNFKAVELDDEKVIYLHHTYPALKDKIIHQSFLDIEKPFKDSFVVIGNFPYNISSQILFKLLDWKDEVPYIIGMFQKEVAERVAAKPGNKVYGVTSALIQPFYQIDYLFDVPPEKFNPPPKVMSAVIKLSRKKEALEMKSEKAYKNLVKTAFNQRRKTLRNAVKGLFSADELKDKIFDKRAEQLSINDFASLSFKML
ncbi:MAG TPA: 16S rRNA (adenine(1518)-N(6)/adenine(1519)-N(6))-dimethyltransferase RsmA [Ferruginibacter sp.]|jgi:16S rRNA (adenine1518-N6/adenine1519-N6)-dimethyltransferase|nr:ribosomal RNA small subunit methyltransferase A [Bacteroidota bacterium]MBS1924721.1 ribosomal RNA small subunit methyltransferase A [Bacteroidota bacterium]HMT96132.1 16S rRNA (adenine(1518)-N(6)/adenine(1519)-N(6))-dimethyltransferase RsmA [Ferruginibacter sp.]HMU24014.1 16S rRNA (adenine(1518)-N(6)/adenine(1519)-N(6))-dimethyltransferase RsmA [Ferruginibacter sp.]